jgi:hypothetical protein
VNGTQQFDGCNTWVKDGIVCDEQVRAIIDLVVARLEQAAIFLFRLRPSREHRAAFAIQGEPTRPPGDPKPEGSP